MNFVDLRSDVLSRPSPEMIEAMVGAARERTHFGLREDPRQLELEKQVAELLGQEDALLFPTCTMANAVALMLLTRPGDIVAAPRDVHIATSEANAASVLSGVRVEFVSGEAPLPSLAAWEAMARRKGDVQNPPVTLFAIENSHNRSGGALIDADSTAAISRLAKANGIKLMIDGARLFNAAAALGASPGDLARDADAVSVSLNKSLGAPNGAILAASRSLIDRALVVRQRLGGGIRPTGMLAAAGLIALKSWPRLIEDQRRARRLADGIAQLAGVWVIPPATNIVVIALHAPGLLPKALCQRLASHAVLALPFGEDRIRMVTYRDIDDDAVDRAILAMANSLEQACADGHVPGPH